MKNCITCYSRMDVIQTLNGVKPDRGGIIVCASCGFLYVFNEELELETYSQEEFNQLLFDNPQAHSIIRQLTSLIKECISKN